MMFTLTFCGNLGGLHTVKNIDGFQHGIPGEILYHKKGKFYGVPAHVVLSISADGETLYQWEKDTRYPAIVNIATSLARHGVLL